MPSIPITLRYTPSAAARPAAWFIPGAEAKEWLDELTRWNVPLPALRLLIVARSQNDRSPRGALVLGGSLGDVSPMRAQPYQQIADQLFIPVDARIDPPIAAAEWADSLPAGSLFVWHPVSGLSRFEPADVRRVADLLALPPRREIDWSRADPGISLNRRLHQIEPDDPPTLEQVLESGRGDIGTQTPTLTRLPPRPNEPEPPKTGVGARLKTALARAALKFTRGAPATASAPTWVNGLENWANGVLQKIAAANPFARLREVERLIHLLETNPSEGLKFAIPFNDGNQHRGIAPPANRLGERSVDFDLSRLSGSGGPADFWDIPETHRQQLMQKYRELATQEMALGRFRRAAYIFAELIGDVSAAAAALTAGKHFREASVLYLEKLQQPLQSARCLEQGGLLSEAADLYESHTEFEKAAELRLRLEEPEAARRLYERAVDKQLVLRDFLAAARLAETRLKDESRALEILDRDWQPGVPQWQGRLVEWFQLCGRTGRHDAAVERSRALLSHPDVARADLLEQLAALATENGDSRVRALLVQATQTGVSQALRSDTPPIPAATARQLAGFLARLHPEDRLLVRDGERFAQELERQEKERSAAAERERLRRARPTDRTTSQSARRVQLRLVRSFRLPDNVQWITAAAAGETYYVAGYRNDHLIVGRGFWDDPSEGANLQLVHWKLSDGSKGPILLAPHPQDRQPLFVHRPGRDPLMDRAFPPVNRSPSPLPAGSPPWVERDTAAIVRAGRGLDWSLDLRRREDSPELRCAIRSFSPEGQPNVSFAVSIDALAALGEYRPPLTLPAVFGDRALHFAVGRHCITYRAPSFVSTHELSDHCRSLCRTSPHTVLRLALFHENRGTLCRTGDDESFTPFGEELEWPQGCFTLGGRLAVKSDQKLSVFRVDGTQVAEIAALDDPKDDAIAILPTSCFGQFAVFDVDHTVRILQITSL